MADRTVLLTGAAGLLGTWLRRTAPPGTEVVAVVHRTPVGEGPEVVADLRQGEAVDAAVRRVQPSLVLHTAYARDRAAIVDATANVVGGAQAVGAELVHLSSDTVFAGDGVVRDEGAAADPVMDYGRWKAEADRLVAATAPPAAIVRPSLLVSLDPVDHVTAQIRDAAARGERTTWFDDELRQPAMAAEVAAALWRLVALDPADRAGVWHLPGPEQLSRYEIAQRVATALGLDPSAVTSEPTPPGLDRPRHLVLGVDRARDVLGWAPSRIPG